MQEGRIFGFWQKVLDRIYGIEKISWLEKPLGGCFICFSNLLAALSIVSLWVLVGRPFDSVVLSVILSSFMVSVMVTLSMIIHGLVFNKNSEGE